MRPLAVWTAVLALAAAYAAQDPGLAGDLPSGQWVKLDVKDEIPKPWDDGRRVFVNSFGSTVYCDALGEVLLLDGYTTAPKGKAVPNNYSDSLYGFHPETGVLRLVKRSNWRAGARSGDPAQTSFPYDENVADPTPCPRHTYNGICYSPDSRKFYLINGANAGVPNEHPNFKKNNGTDTFTFWQYDIEAKKWTQLEYPDVQRKEPYETVLRASPGENALYLVQEWSLWRYDIAAKKWEAVIPKGPSGIGSNTSGCSASVDPKRKRILILNSAPKAQQGKPETEAQKHVALQYFDLATKKFVPIDTAGSKGQFKAGLAYVGHLDKYAVRTEEGLFLFDPEKDAWSTSAANPEGAGKRPTVWSYLVYDTQRKLLVLNAEGWFVLKLDAPAGQAAAAQPAAKGGKK
ncbi:MAG: hypothetical protein L6R28_19840 [Planctomycetes bacterium]|nr:hypothetical protein [Planctomycetota bacterium]